MACMRPLVSTCRKVESSTCYGNPGQNELIRSHLLLYLYKELAEYESIQRPENLHRIASLAASQAGNELRYTDISDQLEVDRRTVDSYLSVLDDGLPFRNLTISHFNATAVLGSTFGIRAMLYFCPNARNTTDSKHTRRPGLSITSSNTS